MSNYVDGFVIPVPCRNLARYRRIAALGAKVWRDHGLRDLAGDCQPEHPAVPPTPDRATACFFA